MTRNQVTFMAIIKSLVESHEVYANMKYDDFASLDDVYQAYEAKNGEKLHLTLEEQKELNSGYVMNWMFGRGARQICIVRLTKKGLAIAEKEIKGYWEANMTEVYGAYENEYDAYLNY